VATFNRADIPEDVDSYEKLAVWCFERLQRLTAGRPLPLGPLGSLLPVFRALVVEADDGRCYSLIEGLGPIDRRKLNDPEEKTWMAALPVAGPREAVENGDDGGGGGGGGGGNSPWPQDLASRLGILLHFDSTNESGIFPDSGPNSITATAQGGAAITTDGPVFGAGALLLNGSGAYVNIPAVNGVMLGSSDFGIYFRLWINSGNSNNGIFTTGGTGSGLALSIYASQFYLTISGSGGTPIGAITLSEWLEVALERSGPVVRLYINGTQLGADVSIGSYSVVQDHFHLGYYYSPGYSLNGKIDEFALVVGQPIYGQAYTSYGVPFPNS
jgi:hypothetical protein